MPWIAIGPFSSESAPKEPPARPPAYHSRNISIEMLIRYRSLNRMKLVIDFCETYLRLIDATEEEMQRDLANRQPQERDVMIRVLKALQLTRPPKDSASTQEVKPALSRSKKINNTETRNRVRRNQETRNRKSRAAKKSSPPTREVKN